LIDAPDARRYKRKPFPDGASLMANTRSAKKMIRKIAQRTAVNRDRRSASRSAVRKVEDAIAAGNKAEALVALKEAEPALVRAAQKGLFQKNRASRKVARLTSRVRAMA
jgi:small subunit ribosomal protein S20